MTVCIAAIANGGSHAVLVADKLVSLSYLGWSAEKDDPPKINYISDTAAILTAGDLNAAQEVVGFSQHYYSDPQYANVHFTELVRLAYERVRLVKAEQTCLRPRGLNFNVYRDPAINPFLLAVIDREITAFDLGVQALAVSWTDGKCSLGTIWNPGISSDATSGMNCIGEGGPIAIHTMMVNNYDKSLDRDKVVAIVSEAKKQSEAASSVGKSTVLCYLPRESNS